MTPNVSHGEPPTQASAALAVRNGPLTVKPLRNGPLMVQGPLEVVSGTGRTVTRATENYFCRCGASSKQPETTRSKQSPPYTSQPKTQLPVTSLSHDPYWGALSGGRSIALSADG